MCDIPCTVQGQPLKPPTTFEEQVERLHQRNLIIEDKDIALDTLSKVNYYRFSAYLLPFKQLSNGCYREGTSFSKIYRLYEFDRKLRNILSSVIEPIEVLLKTKIAYYHAHKYGAEGYTNFENFESHDRHNKFMAEFNDAIHKNSKALFVRHHIDNYSAHFPIWVAVELFSLGMLSRFYANMKSEDRKYIAKNIFYTGPEHLESWLACLTDLRNRCAHYMRLYFHRFVKFPRLPKGPYMICSQRLFDIIYILKYLYIDHDKWISSFVPALEGLIEEYSCDIQLRYIGFPYNWKELIEMSL